MSLTDLKRKTNQPKRQHMSLEDFIDDAEHYAHGRSLLDQQEQLRRKNLRLHNQQISLYKHATFSLTVDCIEQLNHLASLSGLAKSKILRKLINELASKPEPVIVQQLLSSHAEHE